MMTGSKRINNSKKNWSLINKVKKHKSNNLEDKTNITTMKKTGINKTSQSNYKDRSKNFVENLSLTDFSKQINN